MTWQHLLSWATNIPGDKCGDKSLLPTLKSARPGLAALTAETATRMMAVISPLTGIQFVAVGLAQKKNRLHIQINGEYSRKGCWARRNRIRSLWAEGTHWIQERSGRRHRH